MANRTPKRPAIESDDITKEMTDELVQQSGIDDEVETPEFYKVTGESLEDERIKKLMAEDKKMRDFFEEKVTFEIQHSDEENPIDPVSCGVNGEHRHFYRGKHYTEARKFLSSIIKTKRKTKPKSYKDANGVDQTELVTTFKPVFPIQVHHDPSGETGMRWFRHQQLHG